MTKERGLLKQKITDIKKAYSFRTDAINLYCSDLTRYVRFPIKCYPDTNAVHAAALKRFDTVIGELKRLRSEGGSTRGPGGLHGERLVQVQSGLNSYLEKARPSLIRAIEDIVNSQTKRAASSSSSRREPAIRAGQRENLSGDAPALELQYIREICGGHATTALQTLVDDIGSHFEVSPYNARQPLDRAILDRLIAIRESLATARADFDKGKVAWGVVEARMDGILLDELPNVQTLVKESIAAHAAEQVARDDNGMPIPGQGVIGPGGMHLQLSAHGPAPFSATHSPHSIGHAARRILSPRKQAIYASVGTRWT
ncbi:hypothetical protein JCM10908_003673 [Rhodotorula pacifica]|uniref:uncharacterized protein n=1 Tax=Rhodotorula pacifica TaxID=1495444 RepID=UPI003171B98A